MKFLDLAIIGEDWVQEESVNYKEKLIRKMGDLDYGQTRLIVGVAKGICIQSLTEFFRANKDRKTPILCFTEYPNLTRQFFMNNDGYKELFGESVPLITVGY